MRRISIALAGTVIILGVYLGFRPSPEDSCARLRSDIGEVATFADGDCKVGSLPIALVYAVRGGDPKAGLSPDDLMFMAKKPDH